MSVDDTTRLTTALGDGITQMRLPMAGNPLGWINAYLLKDDGGYTLVDCGWRAGDVLAALNEGLAQCGTSLADVRRLWITHVHFDHYGLAGTLRRAGLAELIIHRLDWNHARAHFGDPAAMDRIADAWIERNGLHADASIDETMQHNRTEVTEPTVVAEDDLQIGRLRAIWTPGHTPGHLCLLDTRSGRMLTGDHVLDPITPHVGVWGPDRGDPLGAYVNSLRKVAAIGAATVLPAHGEPFSNLERRVSELLDHHDVRERQVLAALEAGPVSATGVARILPWTRRNRSFETLAELHQQFAVAETIAHLEHLRSRGVVTVDASASPILYERDAR